MSQFLFPWLALVAIILLQALSGTNTDFPAYSSNLKSRLAITQVQLNNLAVASDAGKLFGWLSGIAVGHLPLWSVLTIGSTIGLIGYGVQFLFLINKIATLSYWQYLLLQILAGNSICWVNTACYLTAMRKFPNHHGVVMGLATSYTGLSAKIYIALAQVLLGKNYGSNSIYILLNSVVPFVLTIVTAPFLLESKPAISGNGRGLFFVFAVAGVTGVYAVVETLVPVFQTSIVPSAILLVMVGFVGMVVPLRAGEIVLGSDGISINVVEDLEVSGIEEEVGVSEEVEEEEEEEVKEEEQYGFWKLVKCVEFWLYFWVYLCGGTMGLVYANNLGQIADSRGVKEALLLSISSTFGFFGKLSAAPLSLFTRSKHMVSRPALVAALMVPMAASFFLLLIPTTTWLFFGTAIIGLCSGAITSIAVSMTADLFGPQNFSLNHNIIISNIPIGSLLFGYIAATVYDHEGQGVGRGMCEGVHCYRTTFIIWGSICTFGTLLSFLLYIRTRRTFLKK